MSAAQRSGRPSADVGSGPIAAPPRRIAARNAAPVTLGAPLYAGVTHRVHYEQNRLPAFDLLRPPTRWERWFDRRFQHGYGCRSSFQLPGAIQAGRADVRVRMWGLGESIGSIPTTSRGSTGTGSWWTPRVGTCRHLKFDGDRPRGQDAGHAGRRRADRDRSGQCQPIALAL